MFEKSSGVCLTTLATEKLLRENGGYGSCTRSSELHLSLKPTLFKYPLSQN